MLGGLAGVIATIAVPAMAQNVPPGAVAPPTRDELKPLVQPKLDRRTSLAVEGDIERSPCPLAAPEYAGVTLAITEVRFNNLQGVDPTELRSAYADYLGPDRPVSTICEIRDAAATVLRRKGYLAAIQVPVQKIENGVVQMEVLFARVTAVRVRGDAGPTERIIESYLQKLTDDPVFNRNDAERYLLLARDLPGVDVRMVLTPAGTGAGDLIGEITVSRSAYRVDAGVQNLATQATGPFGAQLAAEFYGLTGMGDRTSLTFYSTADFQEQQVVQLGHDFALGSEGLRLGGQFTYAWTEPGIGAAPGAPKIDADTLFATIEARYPFVRSQGYSLTGVAGLDIVNQNLDFIAPLTRDRLRTGFLRLEAEAVDTSPRRAPGWRLRGEVELRKGLDILGASEPCDATCGISRTPLSRIDGDPTFTLIRARAEAEVALSENFAVFVAPYAQLAFDPVLSFEEFSGGNYTVGRGYEPGTITGDDGFGVQFELRGPRFTPFSDSAVTVQPFAFTDAAWAWDDSRAAVNDPQRLVSVGGGARLRYLDRLRLDLVLAVPTERAGFQARRGDVRLLFNLGVKLLPWSWGSR